MGRIRQIREPDGTLSPYRERKIADSIRHALRESGSEDRGLADELAGVVSLFLERTHSDPERPPSVADIQDTVERVLRETGNDAAARRFRKTRQQREELRDHVVVRSVARRAAGAVVLPDELPGAVESSKWSRTRLAQSLIGSLELPLPLAEEVASSVEHRVFGLGLKCISAGLIDEIVSCELFDRGIDAADRAKGRVALAVPALTEALFAPEPGAQPPAESIGGAVLEHVALAELHGAAVAGAHAQGILHVHGLGNPLAIERVSLPWELAVRHGEGSVTRALLDLRRALAAIAPHVAGSVELPDAAQAQLSRGGDPAAAMDELLDALEDADAFGRARGPAIELVVPLAAPAAALRRVCERAAASAPGALRVRFEVPRAEDPVSEDALALAAGLLRATPFAALDFDGGGAARLSPPGSLAIGLARVTVNLPLLLMGASGRGWNDALAGLDRGARLASEACIERAWVQRKGPAFGVAGIAERLSGAARVTVPASAQEVDVEVWGLVHALDLLVRRGLVAKAAVPEAAARMLGQLVYHLGDERDGIQFHARLGGCTGRAVRKRMVHACELHARALDCADLLAELRSEDASEGVLPAAIPVGDRRNRPLLQSSVVERLGWGLGLPEAAIPGGLTPRGLAEVRAATRIRRLALAPPGAAAPFEVQEDLFG